MIASSDDPRRSEAFEWRRWTGPIATSVCAVHPSVASHRWPVRSAPCSSQATTKCVCGCWVAVCDEELRIGIFDVAAIAGEDM